MGLLDGLKRKVEGIAAKRLGKELSMGAIGRFCLDHKKTIASGFTFVAQWVWWQHCGVVAGIDVLALVQKVFPNLVCLNIESFLQMAAAVLLGMGVSDPQEWLTNFLGLAKKPAPALAEAKP